MIPQYIQAVIFGGILSGICVIVANGHSPYKAGFIASFPLAFACMIFVNNENRAVMTRSMLTGFIIYFCILLLYYRLVNAGYNKNETICYCVSAWILISMMVYNLTKSINTI